MSVVLHLLRRHPVELDVSIFVINKQTHGRQHNGDVTVSGAMRPNPNEEREKKVQIKILEIIFPHGNILIVRR